MSSYQHLAKRLLFVIPICVALLFLILFSHLFYMKFVVLIVALFFINYTVYEFSYLANAVSEFVKAPYLLVLSSLFVIAHFFSQFFLEQNYLLPLVFIFLLSSFIITFSFIKGGINHISYSILALIYLVLPLCFFVDILLFFKGIDNKIWFSYLLVVTKVSDIGGYFFGKSWGRRPMAQKLSPKKTMEGAFFGLVFSLIASVLFKVIVSSCGFTTFSKFSFLHMIALGFIMGVLAIAGDLSESLIKRDASIKHSSPLSNIAGALDVYDSLVFCIPFIYFYLVYVA